MRLTKSEDACVGGPDFPEAQTMSSKAIMEQRSVVLRCNFPRQSTYILCDLPCSKGRSVALCVQAGSTGFRHQATSPAAARHFHGATMMIRTPREKKSGAELEFTVSRASTLVV